MFNGSIATLVAQIRTVWQGVNLGVLADIPVDSAKACKRVLSVDVHGTRAANTLTARPAEGQCGVDLILNLDECIQDLHRTGGINNLRDRIDTEKDGLTMGPHWLRSMV